MRLGTCLLPEGLTLQGAHHKLAGFCSALVAGYYAAVDNWLPLFQIAQIASSQWSDSAAAAFRAIELERSANVPVASGTELLMDIRQSLIDFIDAEIRASDLLIRLINMQDSDWQQFNYGKPITHKKLNKMLRPYGIQPKKRREANVFLLDNLQDAFNRYLPPLS